MGDRKYCYRCMNKYDSMLHICPECGYDEYTQHNPMYIAPGTVLRDRYLVGVLLEYNGEGATYMCHDIATDCNVLLREYMPINLCTRVRNKATISVNYNNLAKYKAFMAEYTELNKSLARLRNDSNINPVLDMFAENNTTYTVFEYIEGKTMLNYLKENAGELSWEQVSKLFPPLFTTIGRLHNAGIIHRAISPDTVYITDKGELRLTGFCVSAVRTAGAGLEYELFKGYAAPEQHSADSSSRQGSWTDVYSICALLYRALTGCMPDDSVSRMKHDDLHEPYELNPKVPRNISRAIMDGMNLSGRDRIQTITELVTRLFEQPAEMRNTTSVTVPPVQNDMYRGEYPQHNIPPQQQNYQNTGYNNIPPQNYGGGYNNGYDDNYHYEKVTTADRLKVPVIIGICLLGILLLIMVVVMNIYSGGDSDNDNSNSIAKVTSTTNNIVTETTDVTETTAVKDTELPDLTNKFYEPTAEKWAEFFTLEPIYDYNDNYDAGLIYDQDIDPGTMISQGTVVTVKVSKGKESAMIPNYSGLTVSQYTSELEKNGITNYQFLETAPNYYNTPNTVVLLQVDGKNVSPGEYFSNKDGKKLIVYYIPENASIPAAPTEAPVEETAAPTEATTAAPDTTAAAEQPTEADNSGGDAPVDNGGDNSDGGDDNAGAQ